MHKEKQVTMLVSRHSSKFWFWMMIPLGSVAVFILWALNPGAWHGKGSSHVECPKVLGYDYLKVKPIQLNLIQPDPNKAGHFLSPSMNPVEIEVAFLISIRYIHYACDRNVRVGKVEDGGWNLCLDQAYFTEDNCIIYSFGIAGDWSFDDTVSGKHGCVVHSFDPTINQKDHTRNKSIHFHNMGLYGGDISMGVNSIYPELPNSMNQHKMRTLSQIRQELGHSDKTIDVVKMDIENWEWATIDTMIKDGDLKTVKQLLLELHVPQNPSVEQYYWIVILLQQLEELGFKRYHYNENIHNYYFSDTTKRYITTCHEVYYVNSQYKGTV